MKYAPTQIGVECALPTRRRVQGAYIVDVDMQAPHLILLVIDDDARLLWSPVVHGTHAKHLELLWQLAIVLAKLFNIDREELPQVAALKILMEVVPSASMCSTLRSGAKCNNCRPQSHRTNRSASCRCNTREVDAAS
jgi:hypothetical protein